MSRYLAGHPNVFMSEAAGAKEPWFYSTESHAPWRIKSESEYLSLFNKAQPHAKFRGEASVSYLWSTVAVPTILRQASTARFLVMLRNPVDLVPSLHNEWTKHGYETRDLETAWGLQNDRLHSSCPVGTSLLSGNCFQYGAIAMLGEQMRRLYTLVDKQRVHWILHDDFQHSPATAYREVLDFLGLPDDGRTSFKLINPSITYRWPRIEKSLRALRRVRSSLGLPGGIGLHNLINHFNVRPGKQPVSEHFRCELQHFFHDDILLLSKIIGRDLSGWLGHPPVDRALADGSRSTSAR